VTKKSGTKKAEKPVAQSEEKKELDRKLEEGLEETFPGSDPVAVTNPVRAVKE
jgi:hypothetical protein